MNNVLFFFFRVSSRLYVRSRHVCESKIRKEQGSGSTVSRELLFRIPPHPSVHVLFLFFGLIGSLCLFVEPFERHATTKREEKTKKLETWNETSVTAGILKFTPYS